MDIAPANEMASRLAHCGSANVGDALRALGKHFQSMDGSLRPLNNRMRVAGPAFTVRCYPGATWALEQALDKAQLGDVLVVDGGGRDDLILMGGLMSRRAKTRGIAGAVVDAAVRDIDDIIDLEFPVFARGVCPRAGTFAEIGEWQTTICCGRVPVCPGDWIVADSSGIAVIPAHLLETAAAKAAAIHDRETRIDADLKGGLSLAEAAKRSPLPT